MNTVQMDDFILGQILARCKDAGKSQIKLRLYDALQTSFEALGIRRLD